MPLLQKKRYRPLTPGLYSGGAALLDGSESDGTNLLSGGVGMTSGWAGANSALTTAATASPDGTTNAANFSEDTNNTRHLRYQQPTGVNTTVNRHVSLYAKMNGRRYLQLGLASNTVATNKALCYIDLQTFVFTDPELRGTASSITNTLASPAVNGFYKYEFDCNLNGHVTDNPFFQIALSDVATYGAPLSSDSPQYLGDGASGAYVWRPKLT